MDPATQRDFARYLNAIRNTDRVFNRYAAAYRFWQSLTKSERHEAVRDAVHNPADTILFRYYSTYPDGD